MFHAEHIEYRFCNFTHKHMLRLIMHTRFTSPSDQKKHRNTIYVFIGYGCKRINYIAYSAVLHIYTRRTAFCKITSGSKTDRRTFIGRNHMCKIFTAFPVKIIAELLQSGVRYSEHFLYSYILKFLYKIFYLHTRLLLVIIFERYRNIIGFECLLKHSKKILYITDVNSSKRT